MTWKALQLKSWALRQEAYSLESIGRAGASLMSAQSRIKSASRSCSGLKVAAGSRPDGKVTLGLEAFLKSDKETFELCSKMCKQDG